MQTVLNEEKSRWRFSAIDVIRAINDKADYVKDSNIGVGLRINYAPDWAIVFNDGSVRHVFFIAETKGSLEGMELRGVEKAKTECAKKLFNRISTSSVKYGVIDKFENLYNVINGIE